MVKNRKITWDEVLELSDVLAEKIKCSGFEIEMLIGLARGGWVPTRLLSGRLCVKKIASIGIAYENEERTQLGTYSFPGPIGKGQRVLLIEDRLESGKSLKKAIELLNSQGAIVHTACYFISTDSILVPDYFIEEVSEDIQFPWE